MKMIQKVNFILSWLILIFLASLLVFKISLNSDSLFAQELMTDLFIQGGRWFDWSLTPAPAYVPDLLLYAVAYFISSNPVWCVFFVSFVQVFLLGLAMLWSAKKIAPNLSQTGINGLMIYLLCVTLVALHSATWLYFYSTNNHFSSLLFSLLGLGTIFCYFDRPQFKYLVLFVGISFIAGISTRIFLINFLVPVLIFGLGLLYALNHPTLKPQLPNLPLKSKTQKLLMSALLIGILIWIFNWFFLFYDGLASRSYFSLRSIWGSVRQFFRSIPVALDFRSPLVFIFNLGMGYIILSVYREIWNNIKTLIDSKRLDQLYDEPNLRLTLISIFSGLVGIISVSGVVLTGGWIDPACYRYLWVAFFLVVMVFSIKIDQNKKTEILDFYHTGIIIMISIIGLNFAQSKMTAPVNQASFYDQTIPPVVSCLKAVEQHGFVLKGGIADFWDTRGVMEQTDHQFFIMAGEGSDSHLKLWMSSINTILRSDIFYNFAIIRSNVPRFTFSSGLLPKTEDIYTCKEDPRIQVWLYHTDALNTYIANQREPYAKRKCKELQKRGRFLGLSFPECQ